MPTPPPTEPNHRRLRGRRSRGARRRWLLVLAALPLLAVLFGAVGFGAYVYAVARGAPELDDLRPRDAGRNSVVYDARGNRLGVIPATVARRPVPFDELPLLLRQATVAIEDRRFYRHEGVDYLGLVRAAAANVAAGDRVQGGSTLTMQLVRNLYASDEDTFERKIREAKLAAELEDRYSKRWILRAYLNNVAYGTVQGQTALGASAAARMFFGRPLERLGLPAIALLAGLPQAPTSHNPFQHPRAAKARRNAVLRAMRRQRTISAAQLRRARDAPLGVRRGRYFTQRRQRYFFNYVRRELLRHYDPETVRRGGLRIVTTLSPRRQRAAKAALRGNLRRGDPSAAVVTLSASSGAILALANSSRYDRVRFNYATQAHRQPGSTFKTFVLAAALRRRIDPRRTLYRSKRLKLKTRWGPVRVRNFDRRYVGRISIRRATLRSDNTVFQQLALDLRPRWVAATARRMGITSKLRGLPAEALGGLRRGVTPLEMARAYATLAGKGVRHKPYAIRRVVRRDGSIEHPASRDRTRALTPTAAWTTTRILRANVRAGTGRAAAFGCPAAGKTGTTNEFKDAWFVGYTPRVATAVWVGYPQPRPMRNVHGGPVTGGGLPAEIWHDAMSRGHGSSCGKFERPTNLQRLKPRCKGHAVTPPRRCLTKAQKRALRRRKARARAKARAKAKARAEARARARERAQERARERAQERARERERNQPPPAPQTRLRGPRGTVHYRTVRFRFSSPSPGATFECSGDGGRWFPCRSPLELRVDYGSHVLRVRAVRGNRRDPTPSTARFRVTRAPRPQTRLTSGPQGQTTRDRVRFTFTSDRRGHFQCRLDGGAWQRCSSPKRYPGIAPGPHVFEVRAINRYARRDLTPARRQFSVVSG